VTLLLRKCHRFVEEFQWNLFKIYTSAVVARELQLLAYKKAKYLLKAKYLAFFLL
jgi:hypothetical protein